MLSRDEAFKINNDFQSRMTHKILVPHFYGKYAHEGRYVLIDKGRLATILQRRFAVDSVIQARNGSSPFIEQKIVRYPIDKLTGLPRDQPYDAMTLEQMSCTMPGYETDGWMKYGMADYLLYCYANLDETTLDCWLVDFPALQAWFWPIEASFPPFPRKPPDWATGRVVPIETIRQNVKTWHIGILPP